jgi:small subunit ribosomal protein S17
MKTTTEQKNTSTGKVLKGVVTSDKMQDTIVVQVTRYFKHAKYQKFIKEHKKYKAHDKGNTCVIGQTVTIKETRPISKDKHFIVVK